MYRLPQNSPWFLALLFSCWHLFSWCQESAADPLVVKTLAQKVTGFYKKNSSLTYSFQKREYLHRQGNWLISHGEVQVIRQNDSLRFRVNHQYDSLKGAAYPKQFDAVSNQRYYGTNQNAYSYFRDYSVVFKARSYYTLSDWPNTILSPDNYLELLFCDPMYRPVLRIKKEVYELELWDTARSAQGSNWRFIFFISKKDFRVLQQMSRIFKSVEDLSSCTYQYVNKSPELVLASINEFVAFNSRTKRNYAPYPDTVAFVPEFVLKDLNGQIPKTTSPYLLLNFWYDGCRPCTENFEYLETLKYQKLSVLSINVSDTLTEERRKSLLQYSFSILYGGAQLAEQLYIQGYPKTYVIDRQRRILFRHTDLSNAPALRDFLEKLCADY